MKFLRMIENEELYAKWDGNQVKYILGDSEVAVFDPDIMESPILFMQNTKANELSAEIKDTITKYAEELDLEELKEIEEKGNTMQQELEKALRNKKKQNSKFNRN